MLNLTHDGVPTLAAVMNFGIYPQGYFPQLGITAIVVPGTEIGATDSDSARFIDNKRIEGTIPVMVEEALNFCRRNMKVKTIIDKETGLRRDRTEYPIDALREAILNAVIHRDYSRAVGLLYKPFGNTQSRLSIWPNECRSVRHCAARPPQSGAGSYGRNFDSRRTSLFRYSDHAPRHE